MRVLLALCLVTQIATAQIPGVISYQGTLTDLAGNPIDSVVPMTFKLYDDLGTYTGWTETHPTVDVQHGLFSVQLGSLEHIPEELFAEHLLLGVSVASDPELTTRVPLSSTGYAIHSAYADSAGYAAVAERVENLCYPGDYLYCYDGAPETLDVGACKGGTRPCLISGEGFGTCSGQVLPVDEVCDDEIDNNCDGLVDPYPCCPVDLNEPNNTYGSATNIGDHCVVTFDNDAVLAPLDEDWYHIMSGLPCDYNYLRVDIAFSEPFSESNLEVCFYALCDVGPTSVNGDTTPSLPGGWVGACNHLFTSDYLVGCGVPASYDAAFLIKVAEINNTQMCTEYDFSLEGFIQ